MTIIRNILICILLLAGTAVAISATLWLRSLKVATDAIPAAIDETSASLIEEIQGARLDAFTELGEVRANLTYLLDTKSNVIRRDVKGEVYDALSIANKRIGDSLSRVDVALGTVEALRLETKPVLVNSAALLDHADEALQAGRAAIEQAQPVAQDAAAFVKSAREVADEAADSAPLFLNCEYNQDCLFNRYQGASKAFEKTMVDVSLTANHIQKITQPHWYDRLLGYGFTAAGIWRDLNPATNVVTGLTRVITTQK